MRMIKASKRVISLLILLGVVATAVASETKVINIQHWRTANGARVYYVFAKQLPMVDVVIAFDAGSARDGKQFGLAALTNGLLFTGTATRNEDQIAESLESMGVQSGTDVDRDMGLIKLRSVIDPQVLTPGLSIFVDAFTHPTFPEAAFTRVRAQQIAAIKARQQSPSSIANQVLMRTLYRNHPYGHSSLGDINTVKAIKLADVKAFYQRYYVANNAVIAIVGKVSKAQAEHMAELISKNLPAGKAAKKLPPVKPISRAIIKKVNYPSEQSHIRIGAIGITYHNPNYFPLYVGNYTLGGGSLVSRLFKQVREKRGLSYGVYSYFLPLEDRGPFIISLQTQNVTSQQALKVTDKVLQNFVSNGPSEQEVILAKKNIIGSFPLQIDSNSAVITNVVTIGFYRLPLTYFDTFRDKIKAVTVSEIQRAFKRQIKPQQTATVIVGRQAKQNAS